MNVFHINAFALYGYIMRSSQTRTRYYLKCTNRHVTKDACIGSFISVNKPEQLVICEINRISDEYLDKDELERNIEFCSNLQDQKSTLLSDIAVYEKSCRIFKRNSGALYGQS